MYCRPVPSRPPRPSLNERQQPAEQAAPARQHQAGAQVARPAPRPRVPARSAASQSTHDVGQEAVAGGAVSSTVRSPVSP